MATKKVTTLHPYNNLSENIYPNVVDENIPDTILRKSDLLTSLQGQDVTLGNLTLTSLTVGTVNIGAGAVKYDGTSLDISKPVNFEDDAVFGKNAEVDGTVTLNSPTDVKFKTGSLDFTQLTDFISNYYKTAGRFRYANLNINECEMESGAGIGAFIDPDSAKWLDYVQMFHNSALTDIKGNPLASCKFPDFNTNWDGRYPQGAGMFDGFGNDEIILGNFTGLGYRLFENFKGTKITIEDGKTFTIMASGAALFNSCINLVEIGAIDLSNVSIMNVAFSACSKLKSIHCTHFKVSFDISASTQFEESDLVEIIGNLDTVTTAQTLTMGATNLAKLTQDEILVATGKGWTLA